MKKQWRMIIISAAVLVVVVLAWLAGSLAGIGKPAETTATTTKAKYEAVFQAEKEDISKITIGSGSDSITLLSEPGKDEDGKDILVWYVQGKKDYPFSEDVISDVVSLASLVYASDEIKTGETDLAPYGLDEPQATLTVTLKSGGKNVIIFGDEIISGYYNYVTLEGSGRICTVASTSMEKARYTLLDLLGDSLSLDIGEYDLTKITFDRAKDTVHLVSDISAQGDVDAGTAYLDFTILEPIKRSGSSDNLTTMVQEAIAIAPAEFVEIDPQDLAQYGLDKPQYQFILETAEKTVTIKIGASAGSGFYYAVCDTVPAVFKLATTAFSTIDMKFTDMIDRFVALESIWTVDKIEADLLGTKFTTEIKMTKDQKADDAKIFSESDKSLYSQFYQRIISLVIAGLDTEASPVNNHQNSLTYFIKADPENDVAAHTKVIEFTKRDDYTYYVFIDGTYTGFYVDGEAAFTSKKDGNEGIIIACKKLKYAMEHAVDGIFNTEEGYQID